MKRVDYTTAVKLKEAGYDVPTRHYYHPHYGLSESFSPDDFNRDTWIKGCYSSPTLHEVTDWLRAKGLHVQISVPSKGSWYSELVDCITPRYLDIVGCYPDHDTALSAAITHALQLLTDKNQ